MASIGEETLMNRRRLLSGLAGSMFLLSGCSDLIDSNETERLPTVTVNGTENGSGTATAIATPTETTLTDRDRRLETYTNSAYSYRVQYPSA